MDDPNFGPVFGPPDPRSDADRAADLEAIRRHVAGLVGQTQDFSAQMLAHLRTRRENKPHHLKFFIVPPPPGSAGDELAVAADTILMRSSTYNEAAIQSLLATQGIDVSRVEYVEGLQNRLVRITDPVGDADALRARARELAGVGQVELGHVVVHAPVVKHGSPPVNSVGAPPPAPTAKPGARGAVKVSIIDSGVSDQTRGDGWLKGLAADDNVDELDLLPVPNKLLDYGAGHGTFVAGIVQQVAPAAEIRVLRAIDTDGIGDPVEVAVAMVAAAEQGADILSLSFGVETDGDANPLALQVALELIQEMRDKGRDIVVVAAAGNSGAERPVWPGACDNVLAVGGLTQGREPAQWSTRGPWVDCSTIAEGVRSTFPAGKMDPELRGPNPPEFGADAWALASGTSFAAPQVAGAIAYLADEYQVGVSAARDMLLAGCETIPGYGRKLEILPHLEIPAAPAAV